jgi:HPt (histidine-containing phosphotransfer) domain-containing protein
MADEPALDRDRLAAITGGSKSLAREILTSLVDEVSVLMTAIRAAASARDGYRMGELAHALKGIAGNVGAVRLQRAAEAVEAGDGGDDQLQRSIARLDEELAALVVLRRQCG